MTRFINFLLFAVCGLVLTSISELSLLNGMPQLLAFVSLAAGLLFYWVAAYQVFRD